MAILLYFGQDNDVHKQVGMAINQAGQQRGTAQIDDFDSGRRGGPQLRRRTNLLDLAVFNQHGGGCEDISGTRIQQSARFDQSHRNCRLGGRLRFLRLRRAPCRQKQQSRQCNGKQFHLWPPKELHWQYSQRP